MDEREARRESEFPHRGGQPDGVENVEADGVGVVFPATPINLSPLSETSISSTLSSDKGYLCKFFTILLLLYFSFVQKPTAKWTMDKRLKPNKCLTRKILFL